MWSLPNLLTVLRVLVAPVVGVLLASGFGMELALLLFVAAALTDYADGWLARRWGQQSALGTMLDPIADKAMVLCALFGLVARDNSHGLLFTLPAMVIFMREILVSGLREYLGQIKLSVTRLAKWKTAIQLLALAMLMFAAIPGNTVVMWPALLLLWVAAGLTLWSGADYFRAAWPHLTR